MLPGSKKPTRYLAKLPCLLPMSWKSPKHIGGSVDAVVFEGFLGPPNIRPDQINNYHKGLKKFYIGVLKHLWKLIKLHGRLVIALPEYHHAGHVKSYHDLIDSCENYGYTQIGKTVSYGRPQAVVKRTISVLQKHDISRKIPD
jgi:hypothetical protein